MTTHSSNSPHPFRSFSQRLTSSGSSGGSPLVRSPRSLASLTSTNALCTASTHQCCQTVLFFVSILLHSNSIMSHSPTLNTVADLRATYGSPRGYQRSYKSLPPSALVFGRDARGSYRRGGDSASRDNWILGKGASDHDGWDGWSVVQGEKRYWDSKLGKPEFRGKCGGAAANRLSEEQIVRRLGAPAGDLSDLPEGVRRTDVLAERRREQITAVSDSLFREYFPELSASTASAKSGGGFGGTPSRRVGTAAAASSGDTAVQTPNNAASPASAGAKRMSPLRRAKHSHRGDASEAPLTADVGSCDVDRSPRFIRRRQAQSIPEPPQRHVTMPTSAPQSPSATGLAHFVPGTTANAAVLAASYGSGRYSASPRHNRTTNGNGATSSPIQHDRPAVPAPPSPSSGSAKHSPPLHPPTPPATASASPRHRGSAGDMAPAGMPTNGAHHLHLPAVPAPSPRRRDDMGASHSQRK